MATIRTGPRDSAAHLHDIGPAAPVTRGFAAFGRLPSSGGLPSPDNDNALAVGAGTITRRQATPAELTAAGVSKPRRPASQRTTANALPTSAERMHTSRMRGNAARARQVAARHANPRQTELMP